MKKYVLLIIFLSFLAGCGSTMSGSLFKSESFVDTRKDNNGNVILLDTPRMWQEFVQITNSQIDEERQGGAPPGVDSWSKHWILRINEIKSGRENPSKYVDYIVEARGRAGLPEFQGMK